MLLLAPHPSPNRMPGPSACWLVGGRLTRARASGTRFTPHTGTSRAKSRIGEPKWSACCTVTCRPSCEVGRWCACQRCQHALERPATDGPAGGVEGRRRAEARAVPRNRSPSCSVGGERSRETGRSGGAVRIDAKPKDCAVSPDRSSLVASITAQGGKQMTEGRRQSAQDCGVHTARAGWYVSCTRLRIKRREPRRSSRERGNIQIVGAADDNSRLAAQWCTATDSRRRMTLSARSRPASISEFS